MTDPYAVIGNPIGHTKSPMIHKAFAEQTGQDLDYIYIEGTIGCFAGDVDAWRARGMRGLNVTAPFKLDAFAYADRLQEEAPLAGAVNCLAFDGHYADGFNYDGIGKGLTPFLKLAKEAGVGKVADGVGMLIEQAAEAFEHWRGVRPDTKPVIEKLTIPLV
jgi:shikimate 5-dehydrogenase